jgi:hypothetical protein
MMEVVRSSETSVYFNVTTRRYVPESLYFPPWAPEISQQGR